MAEMKHADRFARVAARLRARGFEVDEQSGWRSRGSRGRSLVAVEGVMMHHTVDNPPADYPSLRVVRDGRSDLPGPLAQFGVGRSGSILLIAAGLANHAGKTQYGWQQNSRCVGVESANKGTGAEKWPAASMAAQRALVEELGREFGFGPSRVVGHKEAAVPRGRKVDPAYDMDAFRRSLFGKPTIPAVPLPVAPVQEKDWFDMATKTELSEVVNAALDAHGKHGTFRGLTPEQAQALDEIRTRLGWVITDTKQLPQVMTRLGWAIEAAKSNGRDLSAALSAVDGLAGTIEATVRRTVTDENTVRQLVDALVTDVVGRVTPEQEVQK